jgi:FMN-dependent NADH-azoreductase
MNKLLFIKSSPRGERSFSIAAAEAFLASYLTTNPEDVIISLDLFARERRNRFNG